MDMKSIFFIKAICIKIYSYSFSRGQSFKDHLLLMIFKKGQRVDTVIGAVPKSTLINTLDKYIN
uniref:Thioredoxin m n=1 Tax=Compsopogon caeruleus TaxID=31354 RepID=A0A1Z1XBI1_9RHOD|nr:thioredoxin m [Compsopogon caeruleus]ARX96167.1 thioredoxin m [Compsopogon caeruleus]